MELSKRKGTVHSNGEGSKGLKPITGITINETGLKLCAATTQPDCRPISVTHTSIKRSKICQANTKRKTYNKTLEAFNKNTRQKYLLIEQP